MKKHLTMLQVNYTTLFLILQYIFLTNIPIRDAIFCSNVTINRLF